MHARRIDALAVLLARGVTRRMMLAAGTAVLAGLRSRLAAAQEDCGCYEGEVCREGYCWRACETHRDCRSRQNDDPCVNNSCLDGICVQAIIDCLPGYECCFGECCNKHCDTDAECAVFDPCRTGACVDGVCEFVTADPCNPCLADAECLGSGLNTECCGGMCWRPCPEGMTRGKGCDCQLNADGTDNGLIVRDDASGAEGTP
ncbi:MAG: hypothetical protein KC442_02665 [Thermomicrobiales bacterium]|nr:hypothetical protein [Thermomicrobiales bacterium]